MRVFKKEHACCILNDSVALELCLSIEGLLRELAVATLEVLNEYISYVIALDKFVVLVLANEERGAVRAPEF